MLNLFEILQNINNIDKLIEEGKDPIELIHYKYQHIPSRIIDGVLNIDPTKKKSYTQWLLQKWDNEARLIAQSLEDGRIEKLFKYFKEHQDVQTSAYKTLEDALRIIPQEDTVLTKFDTPTTYLENLGKEVDSDLANDFEIVYDTDEWMIAIPNTYEAECKLGENCKWCTANAFGNGKSYYNDYIRRGGVYYVNFDKTQGENLKGKDYPYKRYQFHFQSNQFMDSHDDAVDASEIISEDVLNFYEERGEDTSEMEDMESRMERYDDLRREHSFPIEFNDSYIEIMPEFDDDMRWNDNDQHTYYIYQTDYDDRDPISWEEMKDPSEYTEEDKPKVLQQFNAIFIKNYKDEWSLLYQTKSASRWRNYDWAVEKGIVNYCISDDGNYFFSINSDGQILAIFNNGVTYSCDTTVSSFDESTKVFFNKNVNDGTNNVFVEIIDDDIHSLYQINVESQTINTVIENDYPLNGEYFVSQNNYVYSRLSKYSLDLSIKDDFEDYTYRVAKIVTPSLAICEVYSKEFEDAYYALANINENKVISPLFEKYTINRKLNLFQVTLKDASQALIDFNGKMLFKAKVLSTYTNIEDVAYFFAENNEKYGVFYPSDGDIIYFKSLKARLSNGLFRVTTLDNKTVIFNVNTKQIVGEGDMVGHQKYVSNTSKNLYFANGNLYDVSDTSQPLLTNIKKVKVVKDNGKVELFVVTFNDETKNLFKYDGANIESIFPNNSNQIMPTDSYNGYADFVASYTNQGLYIYDTERGILIFNGFPLNPNMEIRYNELKGETQDGIKITIPLYSTYHALGISDIVVSQNGQGMQSITMYPKDVQEKVKSYLFGNQITQTVKENFNRIFRKL